MLFSIRFQLLFILDIEKGISPGRPGQLLFKRPEKSQFCCGETLLDETNEQQQQKGDFPVSPWKQKYFSLTSTSFSIFC